MKEEACQNCFVLAFSDRI